MWANIAARPPPRVAVTTAAALSATLASQSQPATCIVCFDDVSSSALRCPSHGHWLCRTCACSYAVASIGTAELRHRCGGLPCLAADDTHDERLEARPTVFPRSAIEPLLVLDVDVEEQVVQQYRESAGVKAEPLAMATTAVEVKEYEALHADLYNIVCPSCSSFQDPEPDGCIAMKCKTCNAAFCCLCFSACGCDAHAHAKAEHGTFFPPESVVAAWHRRWRWRRLQDALQTVVEAHIKRLAKGRARTSDPSQETVQLQSDRADARARVLELSKFELKDVDLWPFPTSEPLLPPSTQGAHATDAYFGRHEHPLIRAVQEGDVDMLAVLLAEHPEAPANVRDARQMTPLMHAAYSGNVHALRLLIAAGAPVFDFDRDHVNALSYACRAYEPSVEVIVELIHHHLDAGQDVSVASRILIDRNDERGARTLCSLFSTGLVRPCADDARLAFETAVIAAQKYPSEHLFARFPEGDIGAANRAAYASVLLKHAFDDATLRSLSELCLLTPSLARREWSLLSLLSELDQLQAAPLEALDTGDDLASISPRSRDDLASGGAAPAWSPPSWDASSWIIEWERTECERREAAKPGAVLSQIFLPGPDALASDFGSRRLLFTRLLGLADAEGTRERLAEVSPEHLLQLLDALSRNELIELEAVLTVWASDLGLIPPAVVPPSMSTQTRRTHYWDIRRELQLYPGARRGAKDVDEIVGWPVFHRASRFRYTHYSQSGRYA